MEPDEYLLMAARIVTGGAFAIVGVRNIASHRPIADSLKTNGFPAADFLAASGIAMQIGFGVLMAVGLFPAVAAAGLLVFTVLATLMVHSFWTVADKTERGLQTNMFLANTIMAGGLLALMAAAL